MYLEPIFTSDDIKKKMPEETKKFNAIDQHWKVTVAVWEKEPNLWDNIDDKLKNEFETNNKLLDQI